MFQSHDFVLLGTLLAGITQSNCRHGEVEYRLPLKDGRKGAHTNSASGGFICESYDQYTIAKPRCEPGVGAPSNADKRILVAPSRI